MRKALGVIALTLAVGCVFGTGCSGCSSCSGNNKNVAPLASNWYTYTNYGNIQPTFIEGDTPLENKEKVTYDVKFVKPKTGNSTYSVEYADGTYVTEFYAKKFDTALIHDDFKSGYEGKEIISYYYKTEFTTSVTYKYGSETSDALEEHVTTESYFLSVDDQLRPLYAKQVMKSPTPNAYQATSLKSCYVLYDEVYENFYSYNGHNVITKVVDNLNEKNNKETKRGVGGTANTLFDVTTLEIAIRALIGSGFSQTIDLYTPLNSVKSFTLSSPSDSIGTDEVKAQITSVLQNKGLYVPVIKDEQEVGLQTTAVKVTSKTSLEGVSQTYWFSKVENKRNNIGRATLLKISLPIVFNLGTLEYTIKEVNSTLWNN